MLHGRSRVSGNPMVAMSVITDIEFEATRRRSQDPVAAKGLKILE